MIFEKFDNSITLRQHTGRFAYQAQFLKSSLATIFTTQDGQKATFGITHNFSKVSSLLNWLYKKDFRANFWENQTDMTKPVDTPYGNTYGDSCIKVDYGTLQHTQHTATHCNTLQHTATHCNTLQHTTTHSSTLQHTATHCNILQHTATHCNTLQHTATHSNTLQHLWRFMH